MRRLYDLCTSGKEPSFAKIPSAAKLASFKLSPKTENKKQSKRLTLEGIESYFKNQEEDFNYGYNERFRAKRKTMPKVSPIEKFVSATISPLGCQSPSLSPLKLRKGVNCGIDDRVMDGLYNRINK